MESHLHELTTVQKDVIKNDFAKAVNSFLNCSGGIIVVCVKEGQGNVDLFNQIIGSRLDEMLQDDAIHNSVYSLWHHADHIVFRVKPQAAFFNDRERMPSIYNFHTSTSLLKGRGRITNVKLARLLKAQTADNSSIALSSYVFREDEVVWREDQQQNIPFVESTFVQAKEVPFQHQSSIKSLSVYMWKKSKDYVTAFSKSEAGGSVFFGVKEESEETPQWKEMQSPVEKKQSAVESPLFKVVCYCGKPLPCHCRRHPPDNDKKLRLWIDQSRPVWHVASNEHVPSKKEASGKFVTKGVILKTPGDRKELSQELCDRLKQNVLWLGPTPPQNPIDIKFHAASSPVSDSFVIEVRVNFYNGVCFTDMEGPELYENKERVRKRVGKDSWLKWFRNSFDIPDDMPMQFSQPKFKLEDQSSMTFAIKA